MKFSTSITLRSRDAQRLAAFYRDVLGFEIVATEPPQPLLVAAPGPAGAKIFIQNSPAAKPAKPGAPGLFHLALLYPQKHLWAWAVRQLQQAGLPFHGLSDHKVSWAGYFTDPDGNGLELAWDLPEETWPWLGDQIQMNSLRLPMSSVDGPPKLPTEPAHAHLGHIHLSVADLAEAEKLQKQYQLRVTQSTYPGAVFMARGNYHHHLAVNTWNARPGAIAQPDSVGLVGFEFTSMLLME